MEVKGKMHRRPQKTYERRCFGKLQYIMKQKKSLKDSFETYSGKLVKITPKISYSFICPSLTIIKHKPT